jgi:hypothetical protein
MPKPMSCAPSHGDFLEEAVQKFVIAPWYLGILLDNVDDKMSMVHRYHLRTLRYVAPKKYLRKASSGAERGMNYTFYLKC